jgi:signal transduction histidine kinase
VRLPTTILLPLSVSVAVASGWLVALPHLRLPLSQAWLAMALATLIAGLFALALGRRLERRLHALAHALRAPLCEGPASEPLFPLLRSGDLLARVAHDGHDLRASLCRELAGADHAIRELQEAARGRQEFLRRVSHDLRTPLNGICGYAQLLLEGLDGPLPAAAADDVTSILDSGRELSALVDDVMDLASLSIGNPELKLAPFDLVELASEVLRLHAPLVHGRPLKLRVDAAPSLPHVVADRKRVRQVLTNLVANALKYTDQGHIEVALCLRNQVVEVQVRDTGAGIAPEDLDGLFDELRQGKKRGNGRGAGLGLAICRRLVELHGGTISADSLPGEGSRFLFTLPREGRAAIANEAPP